MRSTILAAFIIVVFALPAHAGDAQASSVTPEGEFALSVSTKPAEAPDEIVFTAALTNRTTGAVISEPRVRFKAGKGAVVRSGNEVEKSDIRMTVSSDVESNSATVIVEYKLNGVLVFGPTLTFPLN